MERRGGREEERKGDSERGREEGREEGRKEGRDVCRERPVGLGIDIEHYVLCVI